MSRGPEIELSTIKDVEDLKHSLAQNMINIPNHVLRRAIILPKDMDTTAGNYPKPGDTLPINYLTDNDYKRKQDEIKRVMAPVKGKKEKKGGGAVKKK